MIKKRLVVLISGNGSNLQAILDACQNNSLNAEVVCVISDKKNAYGLTRAEQAGVKTVYFPYKKGINRFENDNNLARMIIIETPDYIILAGWMKLLGNVFLKQFPNKVVNIHPALPGTFPGVHAIERAFQDFQDGKISHSGVMIHYVPDEGVDDGPVILQEIVPIFYDDDLAGFEQRIHQTEHRLFIEALKPLCNSNEVH